MWALLLTLLLGFQPTPAQQPAREEALARTIVTAVAANDFERLRPLFPAELAELNAESFKKLRGKAKRLKLDLAKAKLVRVETTTGAATRLVDVFLEFDGRQYKTHFSTDGDKLLGLAAWIVDVTKS